MTISVPSEKQFGSFESNIRASSIDTKLLASIHAYRASPEWKRLEVTTKRTWGLALDAIEDKWGKLPLALWNDARMVAEVMGCRDSRAATPRAADIGVTVLTQLLTWCKLRALIKINVAADVPAIYQAADRAEIIWTEEDLAQSPPRL